MSTQIIWYGHAAFYIETNGAKLLLDPFLSDNPLSPVSPDDVDADYILISHGHGDHVGDAVDIAKRTGATVIGNFEVCSWFEKQGISVHAQHIGGGFKYPFGYLKLTIAHHGSALPDGSYGGNPAGFLLSTLDNKRVYFACDTGLFGDMQLIGEEGIDLAAVPIGDNFTMGPDDAIRAVKLIQPKSVIPIHYSTWDLIDQDAAAWAERIKSQTSTVPHALKPGESIEL